MPACTDLTTKSWVVEAGVTVINAPFAAHSNVATAGGCLAAPYLAAWMITRGGEPQLAREALHYVAPVGEKASFVDHAMAVVAGELAFAEPARALNSLGLRVELTPAGCPSLPGRSCPAWWCSRCGGAPRSGWRN